MSITTVGAAGATIAGNIRAEMGRQRRKGTDLAAVLHISQAAVSRRLAGQLRIDVDELFAIATWLGVPVTDLLAGVPMDDATSRFFRQLIVAA